MMQTRPFALKGHTTFFLKLHAVEHKFRLVLANLTGVFLQRHVARKLFNVEQAHQEIFLQIYDSTSLLAGEVFNIYKKR